MYLYQREAVTIANTTQWRFKTPPGRGRLLESAQSVNGYPTTFTIEALHEFIDCLQTKVFEPVYPTVKMAWWSPLMLLQPIVIAMISLWARRTVVLGLWSYFFWAVIILLLDAFEQSAISYVEAEEDTCSKKERSTTCSGLCCVVFGKGFHFDS